MTVPCSQLWAWINYNPTMDKNHMHYKVWDEINYPFPIHSQTSTEQLLKFGNE